MQAVKQIAAERAGANCGLQVTVRCGDNADIGAEFARAADALELVLLQYAQERYLRFRRQITNFVQKNCAAMRELEPADADKQAAAKLENTLKLSDVDLSQYDAIHVAGGRGATFDLFPNEDVAKALEYFWSKGKVVGAICHGAIALGNIPDRIRGRNVTGFMLEADQELQSMFGSNFVIPHYPQTVLEQAGAVYTSGKPYFPKVIIDGKLITGQDQSAASEYALALLHKMVGQSPVSGS